MKGAHLFVGHRAQRRFGSHRQVRVRMVAEEQPAERAVRQRRRHVAQLHQPVDAKFAQAPELVRIERGPRQDVGQQPQPSAGEACEHRERDHRRVGSDLGVDRRADAAQFLLQLDGCPPARPFVQHVRGERREAGTIRRIDRGAGRHQRDDGNERQTAVLHGPHVEAVRERVLDDLRKAEQRVGPGHRQARAVDRHDGTTGVDPDTARSVRPRGTTLAMIRSAGFKYFAAAARRPAVVALL